MKKLELVFTGDLAPIRDFAPLMQGPNALDIYGDVLNVLDAADLCIANLESPLDGSDFIVKSGAAFTGAPEHMAALTPFQAVTLANNHTFDTGREGFSKTLELLSHAGIHYCGAGLDRHHAETPLILERNGLSIAVVTMSEGEDMLTATDTAPGVAGWDVQGLCHRIRNLKADASHAAVIAVIHCGLEYYPYPPSYVYEAFRDIAAAGADLIIGHHVHVPQGMCYFGKTPAFFSLGNFAFFQPNNLKHRKTGYMVRAVLDESGLVSATPVPYRIHDKGIRLLTSEEHEAFSELFRQLSHPLQSESEARRAWEACLAWYGLKGYVQELERIAEALRATPPKGAAMLRNRLNCMQHRMHWTDGMNRIANGTINQAVQNYIEMVQRFFTEEL